MRTVTRKCLSAILIGLVANAPFAVAGYRDQLKVTAVELAQLPKFCYRQFEVPDANGPQFDIPRSCGPGTNHYCPGLLSLMRAKTASVKSKRMSLLSSADTDVRYTLRWMEGYPDCPIRRQVEATKVEVESLRRIYGGAAYKPPVAK